MLALLILFLPQTALEGVSVPERRDLAIQLKLSEQYLKEGNFEQAIPMLRALAQSPPEAVLDNKDGVFLGVAQSAQKVLKELPEKGIKWYRKNYDKGIEQDFINYTQPVNLFELEKFNAINAGLTYTETSKEILKKAHFNRRINNKKQNTRLPIISTQELKPSWAFSLDSNHIRKNQNINLSFGYGLVYASDGHKVVAINQTTGEEKWNFKIKGWENILPQKFNELHYAQSPFTLFEPIVHEGKVLVVLHEPIAVGRSDQYRNIPIRNMTLVRKLYALDAFNGELIWAQNNSEINTSELIAAPPLVKGGRVYIPSYSTTGKIDLSLLCLNINNGTKIFKTFLASGTLETNLFGNILTELATPKPQSDNQNILILSQFGTFSSVNARTGQINFTTSYPRTAVTVRQDGRKSQRNYFFTNNPILHENNHIVIAPIDSDKILVLNDENGKIQKTYPASTSEYGDLKFLLAFDGEYITASGNRVVQLPIKQESSVKASGSLFKFSGYSNEYLLTSAISKDSVWTPSLDGIRVSNNKELSSTKYILKWEETGLIARPRIQLQHGKCFLIINSQLICLSSKETLSKTLQANYIDQSLLYYWHNIIDGNRSTFSSIASHLEKNMQNIDFNLKPLALLCQARCYTLSNNKKKAKSLIENLIQSHNPRIAKQAKALMLTQN